MTETLAARLTDPLVLDGSIPLAWNDEATDDPTIIEVERAARRAGGYAAWDEDGDGYFVAATFRSYSMI